MQCRNTDVLWSKEGYCVESNDIFDFSYIPVNEEGMIIGYISDDGRFTMAKELVDDIFKEDDNND